MGTESSFRPHDRVIGLQLRDVIELLHHLSGSRVRPCSLEFIFDQKVLFSQISLKKTLSATMGWQKERVKSLLEPLG